MRPEHEHETGALVAGVYTPTPSVLSGRPPWHSERRAAGTAFCATGLPSTYALPTRMFTLQ